MVVVVEKDLVDLEEVVVDPVDLVVEDLEQRPEVDLGPILAVVGLALVIRQLMPAMTGEMETHRVVDSEPRVAVDLGPSQAVVVDLERRVEVLESAKPEVGLVLEEVRVVLELKLLKVDLGLDPGMTGVVLEEKSLHSLEDFRSKVVVTGELEAEVLALELSLVQDLVDLLHAQLVGTMNGDLTLCPQLLQSWLHHLGTRLQREISQINFLLSHWKLANKLTSMQFTLPIPISSGVKS